jgi:hypothetical protein
VSAPKRVLELVLDGTFRRDRHLDLLRFDFSLRDFLEVVDRGVVELAGDDRLRLEWCWWWQASYLEGSAHPDVALPAFVEAMNGEHPPRLPPGMNDDDQPSATRGGQS